MSELRLEDRIATLLPGWLRPHPRVAYDPFQHLAQPWAVWAFIAVRLSGLVILVPLVEEIFWRGFLQKRLMGRLGPLGGYVAATLVYGGVHAFSGNLMLILAALVAGAWWGAQYLWRQDMTALIVSHSLWSAVIFAVAPVTPAAG